jgi:hypothetical protein
MIRLIPAIIIMLYHWLFWIKSYGKLLIYSTEYGICAGAEQLMEKTKNIAEMSLVAEG